jgi:hypothetical protein
MLLLRRRDKYFLLLRLALRLVLQRRIQKPPLRLRRHQRQSLRQWWLLEQW